VRLNESQSKNKLYFGNLPRSYTQKQLEDELKKVCKGALGVCLQHAEHVSKALPG
jgi:hypothetical protein